MTGVTELLLQNIEQYGVWGLVLLTFLDSFISPFPPEVLFIPMALINPGDALGLALVTTCTSVVGAIVGYVLGLKGGRPLLYKFFNHHKITRAEDIIKKHGVMAVLLVSFTPIPFKLITVTSGVLGLPLSKLVFWSTLGRGARFSLEAVLIMIYGRAAVEFLQGSSFALLTMVAGVLLLTVYITYYYLRSKRRK